MRQLDGDRTAPADAPLGIDEEVYVEGVLVDLWEAGGSGNQYDWTAGCALDPERRFALTSLPCVHCGQQCCVFCVGRLHETLTEFAVETWLDHQDFYSCPGLTLVGLGLGTAAIVANTSLDEDFQQWYDEDVHGDSSDDLARFCTWFGEGELMIPIFAAAAVVGSPSDSTCHPLGVIGQWGNRCSRSVLVGGPPMLAFKHFLNASRPEDQFTSRWRFFDNPHSDGAVSGHAFVGAIPFLSAAKMTDNLALKAAFYTLSVMPAWARINDRRHYLSQAMLGWWFAYLAADVADRTERLQKNFVLTPVLTPDATGLQAACCW
ncbi:MAG: phosphatase PAP2 family protein [Planctomycetota bacterium]